MTLFQKGQYGLNTYNSNSLTQIWHNQIVCISLPNRNVRVVLYYWLLDTAYNDTPSIF